MGSGLRLGDGAAGSQAFIEKPFCTKKIGDEGSQNDVRSDPAGTLFYTPFIAPIFNAINRESDKWMQITEHP
jgi:hypothetical protein